MGNEKRSKGKRYRIRILRKNLNGGKKFYCKKNKGKIYNDDK